MTQQDAHTRAVDLANATGRPYGVWATAYCGHQAVRYSEGDEKHFRFVELVTPAEAQIEESEMAVQALDIPSRFHPPELTSADEQRLVDIRYADPRVRRVREILSVLNEESSDE